MKTYNTTKLNLPFNKKFVAPPPRLLFIILVMLIKTNDNHSVKIIIESFIQFKWLQLATFYLFIYFFFFPGKKKK